MKKVVLYPLLAAAAVVSIPEKTFAGYLFPPPQGQSFIEPSFIGQPNTEYSDWDVFYAPKGPNYPDKAAPYGDESTPPPPGFTPPEGSNPSQPYAFWNVNNPTLDQTNANAFIIGPGVSGNIYSNSNVTSFVVSDTTPYTLGTVVFQFQTEGTLVDFSSIKLVYSTPGGQQELSAKEWVREYAGGASSFGGATNRVALQWDLTGLGISSYQILFHSEGSSMSFQRALLDTSATYAAVVPEMRAWNKAGTGNWSAGSNWVQGSTSVANGNVRFVNNGDATITLDGNRVVGELIFDTASNVTINPSAGSKITSNTGITTTETATGLYTINSNFELGAPDFFDIRAGEVRISGVMSGAYGFTKTGNGSLSLLNNNTFTGAVVVESGTLRLAGANSYTGATSVLSGRLIVAANAPSGAAGALGLANTTVSLGDTSDLFGPLSAAELFIDGNFTVGRGVSLAPGNDVKRLGGMNASGGATFGGAINLGSANNVFFTATAGSDRLNFSGAVTGGASGLSLTIDGLGTVVYSGSNKTYNSSTTVNSGSLVIASGTQYTGEGNWSVSAGAKLVVNGVLSGIGALTLNGGTLSGSGLVSKAIALENGDRIAPGDSVGTITLGNNLTFASGGFYDWQIRDADAGEGIGWDLITVTGALNITASMGQFVIDVDSFTLSDMPGLAADFNSSLGYVWKILTTTGGITGFDATDFAINVSGFQNTSGGQWSVSQVGNDLYLNYSPIPEPSTWMLLTFGAISAVIAIRLRRRSA